MGRILHRRLSLKAKYPLCQILASFSIFFGNSWTVTKFGLEFAFKGAETEKLFEIYPQKDSIGLGDTLGDSIMLSMVENPFFINPNDDLIVHASSRHWTMTSHENASDVILGQLKQRGVIL